MIRGPNYKYTEEQNTIERENVTHLMGLGITERVCRAETAEGSLKSEESAASVVERPCREMDERCLERLWWN